MKCIAIMKKILEETHPGMIGLSPACDGDREFEGGKTVSKIPLTIRSLMLMLG